MVAEYPGAVWWQETHETTIPDYYDWYDDWMNEFRYVYYLRLHQTSLINYGDNRIVHRKGEFSHSQSWLHSTYQVVTNEQLDYYEFIPDLDAMTASVGRTGQAAGPSYGRHTHDLSFPLNEETQVPIKFMPQTVEVNGFQFLQTS